MRETTERRMLILERLCERKHDHIGDLAAAFNVSYGTIGRDISFLSCYYPIYTTQGSLGGVHVMEGFRLGMKYLTEPQTLLLEKISATLTGEDLTIMREILKTFSMPSPV